MREILELISKHNGQWGWYQLDRALSLRDEPVVFEGNLMTLLKELEKNNLICSGKDKKRSHPAY